MNKLIYKQPDGIIAIVVPAPKKDIEKVAGPLTDEQYKEHVIKRSVPEGVDFREVDDSDIPADRTLRNAWADITPSSKIDIDLDKAREVVRDKRNEALDKLDKKAAAEMRKPNGKLTEVDAKAQELRDIPQKDTRFNSDDPEKLVEIIKELEKI